MLNNKTQLMKKLLPLLAVLFVLGFCQVSYGQNMIDIPIIQTDEIIDEETFDTLAISSDDAEQENDEIDALDDDDLDAGWEGQEGDANILVLGLRFQNVDIPQGATIDSAWVVVCAHEGKSANDVANITVYGIASDSTVTYTEDSLITDRPATESSVEWVVDDDWIIYFPYRTPDLKEIIQEIVDRDGWKPGNAIGIVLAGENQGPSETENAREMESFENIEDPEDVDIEGIPGDGLNHPDRVPRLIVYHSALASEVKKYQDSKSLEVFPNPASGDVITLSLPDEAKSTIRLLDATGKVVRTYQETGSSLRVNISGISNGLYLIRAEQGNSIYTRKLIVQ
jgi:hypothetical protein